MAASSDATDLCITHSFICQIQLDTIFAYRRVGLQHWLQSLIAGFAKKNIEILDNIALTNFLVTGANMAPDGFKLIKRVLDGAASASPSTTPASMPAPIPASSSKSEAAKKSGGVTIEDFHMVKTIGNGSFGRVFLVRRKVRFESPYKTKFSLHACFHLGSRICIPNAARYNEFVISTRCFSAFSLGDWQALCYESLEKENHQRKASGEQHF